MLEGLGALELELEEVEGRLADPELIADRNATKSSPGVTRSCRRWSASVAGYGGSTTTWRRFARCSRSRPAPDREELRAEVIETEVRIAELEDEYRFLLLPRDPNDSKNVIVEIRGAEGGEEANLFAGDLFEMYRAYAARRGWSLEVLSAQPSDLGGFSEIAFLLKGEGVWSRIKHEGGPHRVQRVPVTESQGRIHTSSATVSVLPEADEIDVEIDPNDLQVDVFRSSGPGGQSVNTTDSAVRVTHKPTGLVVSMQDEKSQLQNRAKALRVLRSRLLKMEQDRLSADLAGRKRDQVGGGGRSEKIRTYNFKENRVTDHRIGLTLYKLDKVLAGDAGRDRRRPRA